MTKPKEEKKPVESDNAEMERLAAAKKADMVIK